MPINQNVVGIISYNFYGGYVNYGAVLQSYALQKVLDKLGVPNLIVDYIPSIFVVLIWDCRLLYDKGR